MAVNTLTDQADDSNQNNETVSLPLSTLDNAVDNPNLNLDISLKVCGLFAQTSKYNEKATAFARLLSSAVDAEPESYQQADATRLAAIAILKKFPELLFQNGLVTDHFGRKIYASAYQLFLGAGDIWALKQVHDIIIPMILGGEAQAQIQFQQQFPDCPFPLPADITEEVLYDERNRTQIKQIIEQINIIVARIAVDPCTNGQATLPATIQAVEALRRIFAPIEGEVIRTGLHFPHAMMNEVFDVYNAQFNRWSVAQSSFYSREVIGSTEAALTAVEGQCCKHGLGKLNMEMGPDRRDGLFCRHPKGIPKAQTPISNKLGSRVFVDPFEGDSFILSSRAGQFDWHSKNAAWDECGASGAAQRMWVGGRSCKAFGEVKQRYMSDIMRRYFDASTQPQRGHDQAMRCVIL